MQKLLSLVLSISILFSSVAPAWAGGGKIVKGIAGGMKRSAGGLSNGVSASVSTALSRNVYTQLAFANSPLRKYFRTGKTTGLAKQLLSLPTTKLSSALRQDFLTLYLIPQAVSVEERKLAGALFEENLANEMISLSHISQKRKSFLTDDRAESALRDFSQIPNLLADAAGLAFIGTKEQAPALLTFYEQTRGTVLEDTAALIAARGLLRMQAYDEFAQLLTQAQDNPILAGMAIYCRRHRIPVQVPHSLQYIPVPAANEKMIALLSKPFYPNRLHADPSLEATEAWFNLQQPENVTPVAQENKPIQPLNLEPIQPAQIATEPVTLSPIQPVAAEALPSAPAADALSNTPVADAAELTKQNTADVTPPASTTTSKEGVLYSGIPVFAIADASKRVVNWMRERLVRSSGRFDRFSFPVDLMEANGNEQHLPLTFNIGSSLCTKGYDRIVFHEEPSFENKYVIEMHDHGKEPIKMGHFYMALYNNDIGPLVQAAQKAGVSLFLKLEHTANVNYETLEKPVYDEKTGERLPLKISLQLGQPLWAREMKQAFSHWLESVGLPGNYNSHILANAEFVLRENGEIWVRLEGQEELVPLPDTYYIRLPKNQVANVVKSVPFIAPGKTFDIVLSPTSNRVNMVARDASLTNVSIGKTAGSIVYNELEITEADAKSLMFGINYVLPGFASLLTPVLKKYGEKKLLILALGMTVASGIIPSLGKFYGFVQQMELTSLDKDLFIAGMFLMSGSAILKQLVSNMLIRANRGEVVLTGNKQQEAKTVVAQIQETGRQLLKRRLKEFFTKKSEVSLRDIALYNLSFVYKNIGTLAFLATPFLINNGIKFLTGVDLGIDYSISFPLYAGYSAYVMWKVLRSKLRDAYTAKNLLQSQQMLQNMLTTGAQILGSPEVSQTIIDDVARSFKDSLDALAFAHVKLDPSKTKKLLYRDAKEQILAELEQGLIKDYHLSTAVAKERVEKVKASLKMQENTFGNMWKMLKAPGVAALSSAMTLATVHEFVISSSFAGTMKNLISQGELANLSIATTLYVPFIIGRLGGNWISRRISPQTMYLFCSSLSALGTGIMITAGSSVEQTIAGAAIASLGVGNFFTQMYDYIMNKYPKQNRELSSILALTMGLGGFGAIPAGYITAQTMGAPLDLWYAGATLAASLILTPGMLANSSLVKFVKYEWKKLMAKFRGGSNGDEIPPAQPAAAQ